MINLEYGAHLISLINLKHTKFKYKHKFPLKRSLPKQTMMDLTNGLAVVYSTLLSSITNHRHEF